MTLRSHLRIALVANSLPRGGLERFLLDLGAGLRDRGHIVRVFLLSGGGDWLERARDLGLEPSVLSDVASSSSTPAAIAGNLRGALRLARALRSFGPDVVQSHLFRSQVATALARLPGRRFVHVHAEQNVYPWKGRAVGALERALAGSGTWWVVPSRAMARWHRRRLALDARRLATVPSGVMAPPAGDRRRAVREALGLPGDAWLVGTAERLVTQKRHRLLVEAFARVAARDRRARLLLAGDGPEAPELVHAVRQRGLERLCLFPGAVDEPGPMLSALDVFVSCSEREGFGLAAMEAAARGVPAVLPDLEVFGETFGGRGALFYRSGCAGHLARALTWLRRRPDHARQIASRARERSRSLYSHDAMVDGYEALYESLRGGSMAAPECRGIPLI